MFKTINGLLSRIGKYLPLDRSIVTMATRRQPHVEPLCCLLSSRGCWGSFLAPSPLSWSRMSRSPRRTSATSESQSLTRWWHKVSHWLVCPLSTCVKQQEPPSEHLQPVQPGWHQLLHRRRHLRGCRRRVAVPGSPQQTSGVHGDIKAFCWDLWPPGISGTLTVCDVHSWAEDQSTTTSCQLVSRGSDFFVGQN